MDWTRKLTNMMGGGIKLFVEALGYGGVLCRARGGGWDEYDWGGQAVRDCRRCLFVSGDQTWGPFISLFLPCRKPPRLFADPYLFPVCVRLN